MAAYAQAQTAIAAIAAADDPSQLVRRLEMRRVPIQPSIPAANTAAAGPAWMSAPKTNASAALKEVDVAGIFNAWCEAHPANTTAIIDHPMATGSAPTADHTAQPTAASPQTTMVTHNASAAFG
jgi:hypothetical protein